MFLIIPIPVALVYESFKVKFIIINKLFIFLNLANFITVWYLYYLFCHSTLVTIYYKQN